MSAQPFSYLLSTIPHTRYHAQWRQITWHPQGIFDDALADEFVGILGSEEFYAETPFQGYTDFSGLAEIRLKIGHVFQIAQRRRESDGPVKSALFADTAVGFGIARLYEELMKESAIQVRAFRERAAAAEWLGVPVEILRPD